MTHKLSLLPLAAAIMAGTAMSASAQTTGTNASTFLEEIVVTAQKREATLADTAAAVSALSGDQINSLGLTSVQDVTQFAPSVSYQETAGGGEGNKIYIRGVGRETSVLGTEPGVGLYNNGFYTSESSILNSSVDRVERIEILRGPQGTLYGKNTTGGAINVIAKGPSQEFEGTVRLTAGSYDKRTGEITVSGPVTDTFGYFFNYRKNQQNSFFTNISGDNPIGNDEEYLEGQIEWTPTDNISWNFRAFTASIDNETLPMLHLDPYRNLANEPGTAPSKLGELVINAELFAPQFNSPSMDDPFTISQDFQGRVTIDGSENYQSTLEIDFDAVTVRVLNGFSDFAWDSQKDYDGTASKLSYVETISQTEKTQQHEIQLVSNGDGALQWVLGGFYFDSENSQPYMISDANNPYLIGALDPALGYAPAGNAAGAFYKQNGMLEATSFGVYGQADWQFTEQLTATLGLRYSEDEKSGYETREIFWDSGLCYGFVEQLVPYLVASQNPYIDICAGGAIDPSIPDRIGLRIANESAMHEASWDALDWKLGVQYDLENGMVYATATSGYKPGGFRLGGMQDDPMTPENESVVENEELVAYELGYKGSIGEKLNFAASVYTYDYDNMQVELNILDDLSGIVTNRLANAPKATISGLELESTWAATDNLIVLANYSYTTSEIADDFMVADVKDGQVYNVKGNELNRAPNNKLSLGAVYSLPVGQNTVEMAGSYSYVGSQYVSIFNDDIEAIESYDTLNARVTWRPASDRYEIAMFGNNLTDTISFANGYSVSDMSDGVRRYGRPIAPRTFGIEAAVFF